MNANGTQASCAPQTPDALPIHRCGCGYGTLLDRPYCPKCRDPLVDGHTDPHGIVLSWTILPPPPGSKEPPIGLAMIGLTSGINAMTRFDTADRPNGWGRPDGRGRLAIGDAVVVEIRADKLRWAIR